MVRLDIALKQKRQVWRITSCTMNFDNGLVHRIESPLRRFFSIDAAANYMTKIARREAKRLDLPVKGDEIECQLHW
jgi:hypothetical protein